MSNNERRKLVDINYLSEYLGIPKGTLYAWVFLKKIPYFKIGKLLRFDLNEIEVWIKDKKECILE